MRPKGCYGARNSSTGRNEVVTEAEKREFEESLRSFLSNDPPEVELIPTLMTRPYLHTITAVQLLSRNTLLAYVALIHTPRRPVSDTGFV